MRRLAALMTAMILFWVSGSGTLISRANSSFTEAEQYIPVTEAFYQVNPLYEGFISAEDIYHGPPLEVSMAQVVKAENKVTSVDEAATMLRAALKIKTKNIYINYSFPGTSYTGSDLVNIADNIFSLALEHTGKGDEGDYLKWGYSGRGMQVGYSYSNGNTMGTFSYTMTYYTSAAQEQSVTAKVKQISNNLKLSGKNEYDKILSVYEYICNNVKYNYGNSQMKYTCYAAAIENSAVCQGYALLVYRLLNDQGVGCRMIAGNTNNGQHGWNIVRVNGLYYNVDSTWDAGKSKDQYTYFMKCDSDFPNHTRWAQYAGNDFYGTYPMSSVSYDTGDVGSANQIKSVKLEKEKLSIKTGNSSNLTVKVNPTKASSNIEWESSDKDIATVSSSGKVKGISPGTCKITVSSSDGKHKDTCYVTVTGNSAVKSLKLNKKKVTLNKGKKFKLVVTIKPVSAKNTSLVWKSSNAKIAKITKKGVIKAKKKGKCIITVTTKDGKKKATCKVIVK
ncbi:Ig-like domain-containing protein [Butyrivibrio sp. JL13D10]|uniref:Ig-like domain-containing protein n=1 Tax=Butyrivibrio sp. JL13D10 TaxID=3236815 RepID=UPI0038B5B9D1